MDIKELLDEKAEQYNKPDFIESDPISIPRLFSKKEDIEIAGFLAATIGWGRRPMIIKNATRLMNLMDNSPHDFLLNSQEGDLKRFEGFVHRTFNDDDCIFYIESLKNIYRNHGGIEAVFVKAYLENDRDMKAMIMGFREVFLETTHAQRSVKHLSNPEKGSASKRLNMYLRWMVRKDDKGVDFGIWKDISMADLLCPLDVHSGNVARKLGLISRKANDWKSTIELSSKLSEFDANDPVKYDFALFGLGIFEDFAKS